MLGEFSENEVKKMVSNEELKTHLINWIKEEGLNKNDGEIINLALMHLLRTIDKINEQTEGIQLKEAPTKDDYLNQLTKELTELLIVDYFAIFKQ